MDERAEAVSGLRIELEQAKEEREHLSVELQRTQDQVPAGATPYRSSSPSQGPRGEAGRDRPAAGPAPQALAAPHYPPARRPSRPLAAGPAPGRQGEATRGRARLLEACASGWVKPLQHRNCRTPRRCPGRARADGRKADGREEQWRAVMEDQAWLRPCNRTC